MESLLEEKQQNYCRVRNLLLEIAKFVLESTRWVIYGKTVREYGIPNYVFVHAFGFLSICE